jgi:ribonuclease HI
MPSSNLNAQTRRARAQRLNHFVDRVLLEQDERALDELLAAATGEDTVALCSRIARRATLLARHRPSQGPSIIVARDRYVQAIYGHRAPKDWFTAWCDGSAIAGAQGKQSGIGVVLMDAQHRVVAEFGQRTGALSPLLAELAALEAAVQAATARGAERLRVHTDCAALVHLWTSRRDDERLARLRESVRTLRLQLYLIPRRFNQRANRLARDAAVGRTRP